MKRVLEAVEQGLKAEPAGDARRLFHGRGGIYEQLNAINVDWFEPLLLISLYQQPDEQQWQDFVTQLSQLGVAIDCALVQRRYIRGGPIECLWGELPEQAVAREQGLRFALSLGDKQNIGFFLDMAPGRQWLRQRAEGKRVLNLFAYTCSFSVAAIAGGARTVLNNDMSRAALAVGRHNHQLNDQQSALARDVQFLGHNLFRCWNKIIHKGPYDIVIIDPPSRQKGSFMAASDYVKLLRRLVTLMPAGGDVLACLNAPELGADFIHQRFVEECPAAAFVERLANRADFPEVDHNRNVKMLHYRLPAQ